MKKLIISYIILAILLITAIILIGRREFNHAKSKYIETFNDTQLIFAKQVAKGLQREMEKMRALVDILADIPPVKRMDTTASVRAFKRYFQRISGVEHFIFFDGGGDPIYGYPYDYKKKCQNHLIEMRLTLLEMANQAKNQNKTLYINENIADEHSTHLCIISPVFTDQGKYLGFVGGLINVEQVIDQATLHLVDQQENYIWIMDTTGTLISHPYHQDMVLNNIFQRDQFCNQCHYNKGIEFEATEREFGVGTKQNKLFPKQLVGYAHAHFGNISWVVFVSSPYQPIAAAIQEEFRSFLILIIFSSCVLIILTFFMYYTQAGKMKLETEKNFLERERRLLMERELATKKYKLLFDYSPDPIFIADKQKILQVNKSFEAMLGYRQVGLEKNPINLCDIFCPTQKSTEKSRTIINSFLEMDQENVKIETGVVTSDSVEKEVVLSLSKIKIQDKFYIQGIIHDVSEIKRLEREKGYKENLALLGTMSARIAHEIKNPLASINAGLQLLETMFSHNEEQHLYFQKLSDEVQRVDKILKDMLLFAKNEEYIFEVADVTQIVDEVISLAGPLAENHQIALNYTKQDQQIPARVDKDKLKQVFWNIFNNALQASSSGSEIDIDVKNDHKKVIVTFRDYGKGIDEQMMKKIFQPFNSSKTYGTGLGLIISRQIIEAHRGSITLTNANPGVKVIIELPGADYE